VPLFFYVLHFFLAHLAAGLVAMAMGFGTTVLTRAPPEAPVAVVPLRHAAPVETGV
jgi:hypothetical protein